VYRRIYGKQDWLNAIRPYFVAMKTLVTVTFSAPDHASAVIAALSQCEIPKSAVRGPDTLGGYAIRVEESTDKHNCLTRSLEKLGVAWSIRRESVYSDDELTEAPLLRLVVVRAPRGLGGPAYGTEYDLESACPSCGTGATQRTALVLRASDPPRQATTFETLTGEILIRADLARRVEAMRPKGLELREAVASTDRHRLGFFQLIPTRSMPPMSTCTEGLLREGTCPSCSRDGYFGDLTTPLRIVYRAADVRNAGSDAFVTHEHFGNSRLRVPFSESRIAQPLVLLSPLLLSVFMSERGIRFEPISSCPD
jgi:hypothetical protein